MWAPVWMQIGADADAENQCVTFWGGGGAQSPNFVGQLIVDQQWRMASFLSVKFAKNRLLQNWNWESIPMPMMKVRRLVMCAKKIQEQDQFEEPQKNSWRKEGNENSD